MQNVRIIRKYPNRRLYDTELSCYITLEDLKRYVIDFIPFKVIDAKTDQDVTRAALIQIILELESNTGAPIFSEEVLAQILRFYGHPLQKAFHDYFKNMLTLFTSQNMVL